MTVTNDVKYIGVTDCEIDLFEGQYAVPNGISYNSYLICDEKTAVTDTVDLKFVDRWLDNIEAELGSKEPDFLVVHHMEPDHSAGIAAFAKRYGNTKIVASAKAFQMMSAFFGTDFSGRNVTVGDGDTLTLGKHTLHFRTAPMVHWPEVIVSYDSFDKILFSADGFGKFGIPQADSDWADEARRYFIGIVGKYGAQVQALLKKASELEIEKICPLHGPILTENLGYYLDLYDKWSSYTPEKQGVVIAYSSVYGNTEKAALTLAQILKENSCEVKVYDLARCDTAQAVSDAFCYDRLVLASITYNADVFPHMHQFLHGLTERNFQNRKVGIIENGTWAATAEKTIKKALENSKNITFAEPSVHIKSSLNEESTAQLHALAQSLLK